MSNAYKDGFGLDKKQRIIAKKSEGKEDDFPREPSLDPPFPFSMIPFDPVFFGVQFDALTN